MAAIGEELEFPLCGSLFRLLHRRAAHHWTQKRKIKITYAYIDVIAEYISKLVKLLLRTHENTPYNLN